MRAPGASGALLEMKMNWFTKIFKRKPKPQPVVNETTLWNAHVAVSGVARGVDVPVPHWERKREQARFHYSYGWAGGAVTPTPAAGFGLTDALILNAALNSGSSRHHDSPAPSPAYSSGMGGDFGGSGASSSWGSCSSSSSSSDSYSASSSDSSSSSDSGSSCSSSD